MPMENETPVNPSTCRQAVTMVFIEDQPWGTLYTPQTGFSRGTFFPDLDKPFMRGSGRS